MTGRINALQSLGTLDGPGVRFVAFLQGCPLRCACCHNPETWERDGGEDYTPEELLSKVLRYRGYFGENGGVTLLQRDFAAAFLRLCRENGIGTCLDTSGCLPGGEVLEYTDYCLLDIKYTNDADYRRFVGCGMDAPLRFLKELDARKVPTRLRQVIIPTVNDTKESVHALVAVAAAHPCVQETELLPFRKLCREKYERRGIAFPFADLPEPTAEKMEQLKMLL
mgnify:CR=1 FL=1